MDRLADAPGVLAGGFERAPDRAVPVVGKPVEHHTAGRPPVAQVVARRRRRRAGPADVGLADPGLREQQVHRDIEHPSDVLGPLHEAADPEQRLRDPAQHGASPPSQPVRVACCCCCWPCPCCGASAGTPTWSASPRCGGRAALGGLRPCRRPPSTHVSFEPPPWLEFTTRLPSTQRHPGQAAGKHPDSVAVVDRERPEVEVPGHERHRRQGSGAVDSVTTGWAIQRRGSAIDSRAASRADARSRPARSRGRSRPSRRPASAPARSRWSRLHRGTPAPRAGRSRRCAAAASRRGSSRRSSGRRRRPPPATSRRWSSTTSARRRCCATSRPTGSRTPRSREFVLDQPRAAGREAGRRLGRLRPRDRAGRDRAPAHQAATRRPRRPAALDRPAGCVAVDSAHPGRRRAGAPAPRPAAVRRQRRREDLGPSRRPDPGGARRRIAGRELQPGWRVEGHLGARRCGGASRSPSAASAVVAPGDPLHVGVPAEAPHHGQAQQQQQQGDPDEGFEFDGGDPPC